MKGHRFIVSGDHVTARNTVFTALTNQGFTLTMLNDWSAEAQRGSAGVSFFLGAFAGKRGRHVKLHVACQTAPEGLIITLTQGNSGLTGGLIGMHQASSIYSDIYKSVGLIFQNAGVLVSSSYF